MRERSTNIEPRSWPGVGLWPVLFLALVLLAPTILDGPATGSTTDARKRFRLTESRPSQVLDDDFREVGGAMDLGLAVGPDRLVESSNFGLVLERPDGTVIDATTMPAFFEQINEHSQLTGSYDPDAVYDPASGRFFIAAVDQTDKGQSDACLPDDCLAVEYLAVSRDSAPESFTPDDWFFYELPVTPKRNQPHAYWTDGTTIGVSQRFLALEYDVYNFGPQDWVDGKVRILDKRRLIQGKRIRKYTDFRELENPWGRPPPGPPEIMSTFHMATHLSPSKELFAVYADIYGCNLAVLGFSGRRRRPRLDIVPVEATPSEIDDAAGSCLELTSAPQPGTDKPLDARSGIRAVYRDGSLWVARSVLRTFGGEKVGAIRVVEIDVSDWPRSVEIVHDVDLGRAGRHRFYPELTVDPDGTVVVVYGYSSSDHPASVGYTWSHSTRPLRFHRGRTLVRGRETFLSNEDDPRFPGKVRFADYFAIAADPTDGSVWMLGQYAKEERQPYAWLGRGHVR